MCFGSKEKRLVDDDEAPRPVNGQFPQQPTYAANPSPKSSVPAFHQNQNHQAPQQQQQQYQPQQQPYQPEPVSPLSPVAGPASYQQQPAISYPQQQQQQQPYVPAMTPPAELPAVKQSNPPVELSSDYAPPPGPPPPRSTGSDYAPPPGPPPQHTTGSRSDDYAPPPGPPPSSSKPNPYDDDYAPPSGPPPSSNPYDNNYAPPPGPPPSSKKQHDWESAVPDTSLFPPPPPLFNGFYRSPTSNATEAEAEAGEAWCQQFPLSAPLDIDTTHTPEVQLMAPTVNFRGSLTRVAPGVWDGQTGSDCLDSTVIGYPPLYVVKRDSPLSSGGRRKTVYYEVKIKQPAKGAGKDVCLALGFTALPYPGFRMPGWHRGSVAVHGDDGHKYVNDRWGGKGFTEPFRVGETVGVGMTFWVGGRGGVETEVFLTRGGREVGRWDLHEESDAVEDGPVTGLEGYHDLSCAVGAYQATAFEVVFDPAKWLFRPEM